MVLPICAFCRHPNPRGAKFCNECGAPLDLKPCPQCDAVNARTANACFSCGAVLIAEVAPAAAALSSESVVLRANETLEALRRDALGASPEPLGGGGEPIASATAEPLPQPFASDDRVPDQRGPATEAFEAEPDALPTVIVDERREDELVAASADYRPPRPPALAWVALVIVALAGAAAVIVATRPELPVAWMEALRTFGAPSPSEAPGEPVVGTETPATASDPPPPAPDAPTVAAQPGAAPPPSADPQPAVEPPTQAVTSEPQRTTEDRPSSPAPDVAAATPATPVAAVRAPDKGTRRAAAKSPDRRAQSRKPPAGARSAQRAPESARSARECTDAVAALGLCRPGTQ